MTTTTTHVPATAGRLRFTTMLIASMIAPLATGTAKAAAPAAPVTPHADAGVYFEANVGQAPPSVRYVSRGGSQKLLVTDKGLLLRREGQPGVGLQFVGAGRLAPIGQERLPGVSNYRRGADPRQWQSGVPHFGRLAIPALYPGIDLLVYSTSRDLEYDLVVGPGADPRQIRLRFPGAGKVTLDSQGNVVLQTAAGAITHGKPVAYQASLGSRSSKSAVGARYQLLPDGVVAIALDGYDRRRAVVIDPVLTATRRFGGSGTEQVTDIAVDSSGNVYATGYAEGAGFPTLNAAQGTIRGDVDAFVSKFNPSGTLLYSTFYGGDGEDAARAIAVDGGGRAYVVGTTKSSNLAITNGFQGSRPAGKVSSFLLILASGGNSIAYSSYLGGASGADVEASDVGVAVDGTMWLTGQTTNTTFPFTISTGLQPTHGGGNFDAFVMRVDPSASGTKQVTGFTYFGGSGDDFGRKLARRGADFVVGGDSFSADLRVNRTFGTSVSRSEAFVVTVTSSFTSGGAVRIVGLADETVHGLALDGGGNTYVSGESTSDDLPATGNVSQPARSGNANDPTGASGRADVFVAKIDPSGLNLRYLTYLGGHSVDLNSDLAVTSSGTAYVTGTTYSADFPTVGSPIQGSAPLMRNGFLTKLDSNGVRVYSTYLGGSMADDVVAVGLVGTTVWLGATSESSTFPGANAGLGFWDGLIVKLAD
jgi:hypothetical protein